MDTAPLIYLVERVPHFGALVAQRLSTSDTLLVSDLTRLECRVKPIREGNGELLSDFDRFFEESVGEILAVSREVIDRATEIRAHYGFKTPDAIHLAAAALSNCQIFLTNDRRLDRFLDLSVETLSN